MAIAPVRPLLAAACAELAADFRELAWIAGDQAARANAGPGDRWLAELQQQAVADVCVLEALAVGVAESPSGPALCDASARRAEFAYAIRGRQAVLAGALVAASWQSPSIRHARCSQAGPAEGRVVAHRDDYARDRHPAGVAYEAALAATRSPGCSALLTSCGMSAVVVALAHLEREGALRRGVLLGASTYHETRDLVRHASPDALCVEEHPDEALAAAIERRRPACVFVDAVATEAGAAVPDIPRIAARLAAARTAPGFVDVTGAPLAVDPLGLPEVRAGRLQVLAIESLTKHAQLGLDRVTAGATTRPATMPRPSTCCASTSAPTSPTRPCMPSPLRSVPCSRGDSNAMRVMPPRLPGVWRQRPRRGVSWHTRSWRRIRAMAGCRQRG